MPIQTHKKKHVKLHVRIISMITELSYSALFLVWIGIVLGFAVLYFKLSLWFPAHGPNLPSEMTLVGRFLDCAYYSIITATSVGYGDIVPQGFSKALACVQSIMALFVFAVFVTKLVSNRQEITLQQVHRLTFEDVFHNTREGLYIIRKDFDHIMKEAEAEQNISEENWGTLVTAYRQAQSLIQKIPDFYGETNHLYTLDERREQLLHEAVHRTLHRINQMLNHLSRENIDWMSHEQSMKELQALVELVREITPLWKNESPYEQPEAFEDILMLNEKIHTCMMATVPSDLDS